MALPDLAATVALAQKLAPDLRRGDALALAGPLGAGKTSFARALLRALGINEEVPSPTFTLVQTYATPGFTVSHFDLYRLRSAEELDELGWDDALADGVSVIEWPERAAGRMPVDALTLEFSLAGDGGRTCELRAVGTWQQRLRDIAFEGLALL